MHRRGDEGEADQISCATGRSARARAIQATPPTAAQKDGVADIQVTGAPAAGSGAPAAVAAPPAAKTYTVKAGDTLGAIAKEHLGSAGAYMKIFELNKDQLTDPTRSSPGRFCVFRKRAPRLPATGGGVREGESPALIVRRCDLMLAVSSSVITRDSGGVDRRRSVGIVECLIAGIAPPASRSACVSPAALEDGAAIFIDAGSSRCSDVQRREQSVPRTGVRGSAHAEIAVTDRETLESSDTGPRASNC